MSGLPPVSLGGQEGDVGDTGGTHQEAIAGPREN